MGRKVSLNERRVVTVLSADIVKSTQIVMGMDPDDAMELLDRCFYVIQDAVDQSGGSIISFNGDGALAVFGWPEPMERHADNACCAAWDIQQSAKLLRKGNDSDLRNIRYRVGVHTGLVAFRKIDLAQTSRLDAIGECVHIATHIQQSASADDALISRQTIDLCRRIFSVSSENKASDNDYSSSVDMFRLLERPRELSVFDFMGRHKVESYGREAEMYSLSQLLDPKPGAPITFGIVGDPGIGKSHLAAGLARRSAEHVLKTLLIESSDVERASPFSAARRLLTKVISNDKENIETTLTDNGVTAEEAEIVAAAIASKSSSTAEVMSRAPSATIIRSFANAIMRLVLNQRCLLIVEDLHNIDPDSCAVLERIASDQSDNGLAILVTSRFEARVQVEGIAGTMIDLDPVSDTAMQALMWNRLSSRTLSKVKVNKVLERADGNPFVLEQLIQHIDDAGPNVSDLLPQSVEALIHARLDKISPSARSVAQRLSLLGNYVDLSFAEAVANISIHNNAVEFEELAENGIIHPPRDGRVRFRHALMADACETTVRKSERQRLHLIAIKHLKESNTDLHHSYALLAHHAVRAGQDEEALDYLWRAARLARSLPAGRSLMSIFEQAMACCERIGSAADERLVAFVLLSFETFQLLGEIDRVAPYLSKVISLSEEKSDRKQWCIAQCHLGFTHWYRGEYQIGVAQMRGALEEATRLDHLALRFSAQLILAHHLHALSRIDEAFELVNELRLLLSGELELTRLGAVGLPACLANAFAGYYIIDKGHYQRAEKFSRKALDIGGRGGGIYSQVLARLCLGRTLTRMGKYEEAVNCLRINQEMIDASGFDTSRPNNLGLLCTSMSRIGQADEAVKMVQKRLNRDLVERTGKLERHYFSVGYGEALAATGRLHEGLAEIDDAILIGRTTKNMGLLIQSIGLKASVIETTTPGHGIIAKLRGEERCIAEKYGLSGLQLSVLSWD